MHICGWFQERQDPSFAIGRRDFFSEWISRPPCVNRLKRKGVFGFCTWISLRYARCSTNEDKQDIKRQIRELKAGGAEKVIFEYEHGDCKVKKQLSMLQESVHAGDTITTLEVSRLSRSTQQLCEIIDIIREKCLRLIIVGSITIDCRNGQTDPMSEAFLQMAGVFSQLELAMIRARVKSGVANAKAKGKKVGRPQTTKEDIPAVLFRHYPMYVAGKMNVSELTRVCGLSRPTVYKYLKLMVLQ